MKRVAAVVILIATAVAAWAVQPVVTVHTTEANFSEGTFEGALVSSRGDVSLAPRVNVLLESAAAPAVVSAVAVDGDNVYIASGVDNVVSKVVDGKASRLAAVPSTVVTALAVIDGTLYAAGGGDAAGVWALDENKTIALATEESARYVWAIAPAEGGAVYVATGAVGGVWRFGPDGKAKAIWTLDGKLGTHVLSLARGRDGKLYAGTDTNGLVYEIDPATGAARVILDAGEKEIAAIVPDDAGGLYVATSDASRAAPEDAAQPSQTRTGRSARPAAEPADANDDAGNDADKAPARAAAQGKTGDAAEPRAPSPRENGERPQARPSPPTRGPGTEGKAQAEGNAVYYIRPNGLVETLFRRPVTILGMRRVGDRLVLATGNGGKVYSISLDGDEVFLLADTEAKQVTSLTSDAQGAVVFGTANAGSVVRITAQRAESGTFVSPVVEASQTARWGSGMVVASIPAGATLTFAARTGNVQEPSEATWSPWSKEVAIVSGQHFQLPAPAGRFLQYRLTLKAGKDGGPVVERVELIHQVANLPPAVSALQVTPTAGSGNNTSRNLAFRQIEVTANDPNGDTMSYDVKMRLLGSQDPWITIARDQSQAKYVWDTRSVADGIYELRIEVSDRPGNPSTDARAAARISEPVTVDNSAPTIRELNARPDGKAFTVSGEILDKVSRIQSIEYSIDSADEWHAVAAADGIVDSPAESFRFATEPLEPGTHRVAVKVTDVYGNVGFAGLTVNVAK